MILKKKKKYLTEYIVCIEYKFDDCNLNGITVFINNLWVFLIRNHTSVQIIYQAYST